MRWLIVTAVLLSGCCCQSPMEEVEIVSVVETQELGEPNHYTVVEFPDGSRRMRHRSYGKPGDTFKARKLYNGSWE